MGGNNIPITLVVKKDPNLQCYPNDDGYDSITKYMKVVEKCDTNILEGEFRIAEVGSMDSFDVKLNIRGYFPNNVYDPSVCTGLDFYNYDKEGAECVMEPNFEIVRNYRFFQTANGASSTCQEIFINECKLDLKDIFTLKYFYENSQAEVISINAKGRKL